MPRDKDILRDLAQAYAEVCAAPVQEERRRLWRQHNSLKQTRPLIYVRAFAFHEMPAAECHCEDRFYREQESALRHLLFWNTLNDDSVFEPWISLPAVRKCNGWGVPCEHIVSGEAGGSYKIDYPIKDFQDIDKLRKPWHEIDEQITGERARRLQDAIGDILTVDVDRAPPFRGGILDISSELGMLRGIENFMMDMSDNPDWLRRLVRFIAEGVGAVHDQAEAADDWGLNPHRYTNQAMAYAGELDDPAPNVRGVPRSRLWGFMAAQEFTGVSPAMHEEFLLRYQLPILKKFGLVAYGCCEDLTNKIDMLRQIPNLRRIAVSPFANVRRCAEQIGRDYVLSYRPSPADMVSYNLHADAVRAILRKDLEACRDCHVDITLKDVETVQRDPERVRNWVALVREVIDEIWK